MKPARRVAAAVVEAEAQAAAEVPAAVVAVAEAAVVVEADRGESPAGKKRQERPGVDERGRED
jgi:hypothetical protein